MRRRLSRRKFIGQARTVALATPFLSLMGCSEEDDDRLLSFSGETMGTTYSVKLVDVPLGVAVSALPEEIASVLEAVNQQMSTYRPDSELSGFNAAGAETWIPVSADVLTVVEEALRVSRLTAGAFDPTVGPMVDLWGFGPGDRRQDVPSSDKIAAMQRAVGHALVETRTEPSALAKVAPGVGLDLSGVAKGFGVDKVAELLQARGVDNYLVEVGGELRGQGNGPGGRPWRVGIEKPTAVLGDIQRIVDLNRAALATSGDYRLFFERDGQRYSHILDPSTGHPVDHALASVTVVAATTMEADAFSTSLLVLGPEAGLRFASEHDVAAYFVVDRGKDFTATASPAFQRKFGA